MRKDTHPASASYFDRDFDTVAVKIVAGELYATADATAITTLLGSCVSVCLYDRQAGVGGMNHFMLPELLEGGSPVACSGACTDNCCARYGSCAMRQLLRRLELLGANRRRLEAKLFGAACMIAGMADIGRKNAAFALNHLKGQQIPVITSDLGERSPRKIIFFPATGRAFVKKVRDLPAGI